MYYIGIDLGGTDIKCGVVDYDGNILYKASAPTPASDSPENIVFEMAQLVSRVIESSGVEKGDIQSIGIGSPGSCDSKNGVLLYANNINFDRVPLRTLMQQHIDLPVFIGNDANCAAWGEYCMMEKKCPNMVFITLGTGVGGGAVINGRLYEGFNGAAMEVGHITLMRSGKKCTCGRRGCYEAYASVSALKEMTLSYIDENPESPLGKKYKDCKSSVTGKTAFDAAREGDDGGAQIVSRWTGLVAEGLVDIINLLQPELLLIGGGISREGDFLLNPIKEYVSKYIYNCGNLPQTRIEIAAHQNDAGLIGAAFLGR